MFFRPKVDILIEGPSGISFCKAALRQNHTLTIYARNPSKVPTEVSEHAQVTVLKGTFDDNDGLEQAAKCGADTFVSFAGPVANNKGTVISFPSASYSY